MFIRRLSHLIVDRTAIDGSRIDRYLKRVYPSLTQGIIEKFIRKNCIKVNSKIIRLASSRVKDGDSIFIEKEMESFCEDACSKSTETLLDEYSVKDFAYFKSLIIWENEDMLVINKPAGLATQGGSGIKQHVDKLLISYKRATKLVENLRLVHRLDRLTSGALVIAKTLRGAVLLNAQFKNRSVSKTYIAVVHGILNGRDTIQTSIMKSQTSSSSSSTSVKSYPASTSYRVLGHLPQCTVVEVSISTGRTHQIRVHMSSIKHPIVGDPVYTLGDSDRERFSEYGREQKRDEAQLVQNANKDWSVNDVDDVEEVDGSVTRLMLHSWRVAFKDCIGESVVVHVDLPGDMKLFMKDMIHCK